MAIVYHLVHPIHFKVRILEYNFKLHPLIRYCSSFFFLSFLDRKRISRPLTGRHVRQGTPSHPTTLANLRSMIKERQKFRELNGGASLNGKKIRKKRK